MEATTFGSMVNFSPHALRREQGKFAGRAEPMNAHTVQSTFCSICGRDLSLRDCTTDEHGRAVHEECLADRIKSEMVPSPPPERKAS
jgi:hypothetical protein